MSYTTAAETLSSQFGLDLPPIALTFVEAAPSDIPTFAQEVPSACAFWRKAEGGVFYASAEQHFHCAVGALTMGFALPSTVQQELMGVAEMMIGCGYLASDEPANLPSVEKPKNGIVYGPLADFPLAPDVVMLWLTPRQSMLLNEAIKACHWGEAVPAGILGRPACSALPITLRNGRATLSFGCAGMRTFTGIAQDRLLAVLPGDKMEEFLVSLQEAVQANATMQAFYDTRKAGFPA